MLKHPWNVRKREINPSVLINLTSYYSYGWTKNCLLLLRKYLPASCVIVIDNNPSIDDDENRLKSFSNYPWNSIAHPVQNNSLSFFEAERKWLKTLKNTAVVQTKLRLFHGEAMNLALDYAFYNRFDILVHIEPDCIITGPKWFYNLLEPIKNGAWMSSGVKLPDGSLHPCPSAWFVSKVRQHTFKHIYKGSDFFEPQFPFLVDVEKSYEFEQIWWDTSKKAWYECAKNNKAVHVETPDFQHLWAKSSSAFNLIKI